MTPYVSPGLQDIDDVVSEVWKIDKSKLYQKTRKREVVEARQTAMWFKRNNTTSTLSHIAERYCLHHCSVLWAERTVTDLYETDPRFRMNVDTVFKKMKWSCCM